MYYRAFATDYDGTIATHGIVDDATLAALSRVRDSGRHLILVTGRELPSLFNTFAHVDLFDVVVAENGGLLYYPETRREQPLCDPPPEALVQALRDRNVHPLSVGRTIIATVEPHEGEALDAIRRLGLEYQVIFNKGAVMVLPSGVNKASGLEAALRGLGVAHDRVVAIGDAENDHALLGMAGFSAAVANALPALKDRADYVTQGSHGAGVAELAKQLLDNELRGMKRHRWRATPIAVQRLGDDVDVTPDA